NINLTVQDATGAAVSGTFALTVNAVSVAPPSLGALSSTAWTVSQAGFSATIPISGGLAPFDNLSVTGLPAGGTRSLSDSTITLGGTPTTFGTFNLGVTVNDATGAVASAGFTLTVNTVPTPGALTSNQWDAGQPGYPGSIPIGGGTGAFTVVDQSSLPPGLSAAIAGTSVVLTGTPTTAGTFAGGSGTAADAPAAPAPATVRLPLHPPPPPGAPAA